MNAAAFLSILSCCLFPVAAAARTLSVEDQLRTEDITRAFFSPDGSRAILEYSPPWNERNDPGVTGGEYDPLGSAVLLGVDLNSSAKVSPVFEPAPGAGYWVDAFSPTGRYVAISWLVKRQQKAGVFDFERRKLMELPFVPYLSWFQLRPVWISDHELVYAARRDGQVSAAYFYRLAIADRLTSMWDKAWQGREPAVTVLNSRVDDSRASDASVGALVKVDARTGSTVQLSDGLFTTVTVSPNRQFVAAVRMGEFAQTNSMELEGSGVDRRRGRLFVFNIGAHSAQEVCKACDVMAGTLEWSADSRSLLAFSRLDNDPWHDGRFVRYSVGDRKLTRFEHRGLDVVSENERWLVNRPEEAALIADHLVVFARKLSSRDDRPQFSNPGFDWQKSRGRADWFAVDSQGKAASLTGGFKVVSPRLLGASKDALYVLADGAAWRLSLNQHPKNLTAQDHGQLEQVTLRTGSTSDFDFSLFDREDSTYPYAILRETGEEGALILLNLQTGMVERVGAPSDKSAVLAWSSKRRAAIYYTQHLAETDIDLVEHGHSASRLVTLNTYLADVMPARRIAIPYSVGGQQLTGCALLPPGWMGGQRYAAIVEIYPNRRPHCDAPTRFTRNELFPSWGYVYFEPETPREIIRGPEGPLQNLADVLDVALNELVARAGADPDRLGLFGESQGGFAVPWELTQSHRFKAAVAVRGATDHASLYGSFPLAMAVLPEEFLADVGVPSREENVASDFYLGGAPWQRPELYVSSSPYFQSEKIDTPLMLIHSDMDFFPIQQYEMLFSSLYRQRKEAVFVRYWGEGHWLRSPANVRDEWRRIRSWYDIHLTH